MCRLGVSNVSALSSCVANDHQTMHHVSYSRSKIPHGGFSPVRLQSRLFRRCLPAPTARTVCRRPSCSPWRESTLRSESELPLGEAPPLKRSSSLYPRGPRSGAGYAVPCPHRLIDPIRPTGRHIETSPHGGLYPMPSLGAEAPRPASGSVLSLRIPSRHAVLYDPGELVGDTHPVASPITLAFAVNGAARHSR
jgi:hypothetical protein